MSTSTSFQICSGSIGETGNSVFEPRRLAGTRRNVETVIQEWIETAYELGRPIPEPKGRLLFA
jgi:hypothetical protein